MEASAQAEKNSGDIQTAEEGVYANAVFEFAFRFIVINPLRDTSKRFTPITCNQVGHFSPNKIYPDGQEYTMETHRFGRKLKLPSTFAIKHQIRKLMFENLVKEAEVAAKAEAIRRSASDEQGPIEQIAKDA